MSSAFRVVIVGESWGKHEARFRHPLVWWSGRELAKMMAEAGLASPIQTSRGVLIPYPSETDMIAHWRRLRETEGVYVTNVFQEHPPDDKTETFFEPGIESDLPPMKIKNRNMFVRPSHRHHIDRLYEEIKTLRPNLILALGNYAIWALLNQSGITSVRGTVQLGYSGIKVLPTFHPAALRDMSLRPTIVADLEKAAREAEFPEIRRIKRWIIAEDPATQARVTIDEIRAWFQKPADEYSVDIESGYVLFRKAEILAMPWPMRNILASLISMVSFARSPYDACVIPFMVRRDPSLNYWSEEEEIIVFKIMMEALDSPVPKTFQNGIYDISQFLRYRLRVHNCRDDSMIASHALMPERRKSLDFLASIISDEIAWKQMVRGSTATVKREG